MKAELTSDLLFPSSFDTQKDPLFRGKALLQLHQAEEGMCIRTRVRNWDAAIAREKAAKKC
jgi:hypothetical protein